MPEGDTLWRVANRLSPVLSGRRVTALRLATPALTSEVRRHHVEGSTVLAVEARGKHLLVRFSTGVAMDKLLQWLTPRRWDPARPERVGYDVVDLVTYMKETAATAQPFADRKALEKARSDAWRCTHKFECRARLSANSDAARE